MIFVNIVCFITRGMLHIYLKPLMNNLHITRMNFQIFF
jgi:hypothetical protein